MKITKIIIISVSFCTLLYTMEDYEGVEGSGRTVKDLIAAGKVKAEMIVVQESLCCSNCEQHLQKERKNWMLWIKGLNRIGSFSINIPLTDLFAFKCLDIATLENCFIREVQFNADVVLPALKRLSLARNYLKKIELTKILTMALQLEELDLSLNPIQEIVLENEYQHENFLTINLEKTNYSKQLKSNEFINKLFNSTHGKKLLIKW